MTRDVNSAEELLGISVGNVGGGLRLARSIERGLPVSELDRLAEAVAPGDSSFRFRIVPKATLDRRRRTRRLSSEEGNRVARLAKVYALARSIFHDEAKVRAFLTRPHPMLEGQAPLDVTIATGPGADVVVNLLGRAAYSGGV